MLSILYDNICDGFVSLQEEGRFRETEYISIKFKLVLNANTDLPMIRFHDLRHTNASLMLAGVDMKTISERLGHSQIGITMDLYSHVSIEMQEKQTKSQVKYSNNCMFAKCLQNCFHKKNIKACFP